ncbi:MAG: branched-chain amino acid ABC transporter permease [Clostridia bacterium]
MDKFKKVLSNPFAVILCNVIIAVLIREILITDFIVSLVLMVAVIVAMLLLDKFGIINALFDAYIAQKTAAIISGIMLVIAIPISLTSNNYIAHIATMAVVYGIACLGLNFQMGSTDMTNFAPAAFMGIGAYSVAVCTTKFGLSPWVGMLMGIFISGLLGLIVGLPTLKTKGYYLSLVTMAIQLAFTQLMNNIPALGGANGIPGVEKYSIFGFQLYKKYTVFGIKFAPQIPYLLLCIGFLILFTYIAMRVYYSKSGLSLNAIAQDEIAANCLGINASRQKLFAFVIGSIFCGVAGSLLVGLDSYVGPSSYNFARSLVLICMVILGGMDNSIGIIVGAFLLAIISEKLRDFADFQQLVYGLILVTMLIVRPNGIIPKRVRNYCGITKRTLEHAPKAAEVPQAFEAGVEV